MKIPTSFSKAIANVFYDKTVSIIETIETVDAEGGVKIVPGTEVLNSFVGNVNFSNLKEVQEELGLTYDIDVTITTSFEDVKVNDYILYGGFNFVITDVIPYDSHSMIVATKYGKVERWS